MDRYDAYRYGRERTTREDQVLDLIKDYRYFAPALLARHETQARQLTDAAFERWEDPDEVADRTSLPRHALRMRLGALLIRLGIQLRDGLACDPGASAAIVVATSHGGG